MCGIFGIIATDESKYSSKFLKKTVKKIASLSETRGKDSSGICFRNSSQKKYSLIKATSPISEIFDSNHYSNLLKENLEAFSTKKTNFTVFGHSRLVTNGSQLEDFNNQPVLKDNIIAIHNGIIANDSQIWEKYSHLEKKYDIDTEIMLSLVSDFINKGDSIQQSIKKTINEVYGTVSTAMFFKDKNDFVLGTNNGSLYYATNSNDFLIFASERYMLEKLISDLNTQKYTGHLEVSQLKANNFLLINLDNLSVNKFNVRDSITKNSFEGKTSEEFDIEKFTIKGINNKKSIVIDVDQYYLDSEDSSKRNLLINNEEKINRLKKCTKCILPETFPFISFDALGVCNYCNNYIKRNQPKSIEELKKIVQPYKSKNGEVDCLVPFSGGRDSTFVLHFVKKVLGLNPIAYTYDWGMVTDLARRNIARVCGKLGVENIIVAADIKMKRRNIRLNIEAWLKNPNLGMIPLFMAGDKQFFKYANVIKRQAKLDLNIWGINFLENTDFKVGFCGVPPDWGKEMIYSMSAKRKGKLFGFVAKNFIKSPSYINSSIYDTIDSFLSRYLNPRKDYYHFFDFYKWDEKEIEDILINEYDWEIAKDIKSTWRIGDGTASFYNYIYYTVAGFSEFDTFRSNQIREGILNREEAIELVKEENKPRYNSLRWYVEIVGLNFEDTIKKINQIPTLY